jgi:hypothetical protein
MESNIQAFYKYENRSKVWKKPVHLYNYNPYTVATIMAFLGGVELLLTVSCIVSHSIHSCNSELTISGYHILDFQDHIYSIFQPLKRLPWAQVMGCNIYSIPL